MDEGEWETRHELGVGRIMWGSDYPHIEGSWPHTAERLGEAFKNVPRDQVSQLVGGTAARVYGFDVDELLPLAAVHGPPLDSMGC